jgi:hypothetical protein
MPVYYGYGVQIDTKPLAKPTGPGPNWNTMIITIDGPHTVVDRNGMKVTDYHEGHPVPPSKFDFEPRLGPAPMTATLASRITARKTRYFSRKSAFSRCRNQ